MKLTRPVLFMDLETTGVDIESNRIVQIAFTKLMPDLSRIEKSKLINPGVPIPITSTEIHGITDEMVKDEPLFRQVAKGIIGFMQDCDLGGFNSNSFDFPFLQAEFSRNGFFFDFTKVNLIDVGNIFKIENPRTLAAAYKHYVGSELENAHDAQIDINATVDVFLRQIEQHDTIPQDVNEIALYSNYGRKMADLSGKFYYDEQNELRLNFGKHKGNLAKEHCDFLNWMCNKANFPSDTYALANEILQK